MRTRGQPPPIDNRPARPQEPGILFWNTAPKPCVRKILKDEFESNRDPETKNISNGAVVRAYEGSARTNAWAANTIMILYFGAERREDRISGTES
jgi:hypothetical protein